MDDAGTPYASFREHWHAAEPEWRVARVLFAGLREPRHDVALLLEYQLREAALTVADTGVARTKLAWWQDELQRTAAGQARHPVTQHASAVLGAEAIARLLPAVGTAARLAAGESIASLEALVAMMRAVLVPFAAVHAGDASVDDVTLGVAGQATAFGGEVEKRTAGQDAVAAAAVVLAARYWSQFARPERALLPLDVLARTGVSRTDAQSDGAAVAAALLQALQPLLDAPVRGVDAARVAVARSVARHGARRPREFVAGAGLRPRLAWTWRLWRAARAAGA